jgi:bidirectional [NiFe] hydrogenase diaphorase subunit
MNVPDPPQVINLKINGIALQAQEGQTILDIAKANNIRIPTLCFVAGLSAVGACRLCLVEIKGIPRLLPACSTAAAEGMQVETHTVRLQKHRQRIVELLFAERNHVCATCVSNGRCELQSLAQELGVTHTHYRYRFEPYAVDASHSRFVHDPNRCILCTRCVRVCAEVEGAHTWDVKNRGICSDLTTDLDTPWGESDSCTSCGKCVQICPTGALFEKGKATGEMAKRREFLTSLSARRRGLR